MKKEACIIMHIVPDYIIAKAAVTLFFYIIIVFIIILINLLLHSSVYRWSLLSY